MRLFFYSFILLFLISGGVSFAQVIVPAFHGAYASKARVVVPSSSCGAFVAAGVYKEFMCHNLGADTSLDPNIPVQGIHGNYYQWGRSEVVANTITAAGAIAGWNTASADNGAWTDASKTANDPCPAGYRVPTNAQWNYIATSPTVNFVSRTGTWTNSSSNFGSAIHFGASTGSKTLTLPASGHRLNTDGTLHFRNSYGIYWSSTENGSSAANLNFNSSSASTYNGYSRTYGLIVRCIKEDSKPDVPTNVVAAADNAQASIAFTAPLSNGGSAITGYTVTSFPGNFTASAASSPIVVSGLTNGTSYTFTVVATNSVGNSDASLPSASTVSCGAFVAAGVWKQFMCHNLGADSSLDPSVPVQGIHGNYYQWGRSEVVANASTPAGTIAGWNTVAAANGAWTDASKTATDPCPAGYRVPTRAQWNGVIANNTVSRSGPWANGNFTSALHFGTSTTTTLSLPAAGIRNSNGSLVYRGSDGYYWSTTASRPYAYYFNFSGSTITQSDQDFNNGFSVRCVSE